MLERSCISSLLGEIDYYPHKITETTIVIMETLSGLGPMRFYFLSWEGFSMINILGIIILFLFYFFYLLIIFAGIDFVSIRKSENLYYFSNIIRPNISRSGTYYALLLGYTFVTESNEFWLIFEPQISPTRLEINFLFISRT